MAPLNTIFGWTISGAIPYKKVCSHISLVNYSKCSSMSEPSLDDSIRRSWEQEEFLDAPVFTNDDKLMKAHYTSTLTRSESVFHLPFGSLKQVFTQFKNGSWRIPIFINHIAISWKIILIPIIRKCDPLLTRVTHQNWIPTPFYAEIRKLRVVNGTSCPEFKNTSLNGAPFSDPKSPLHHFRTSFLVLRNPRTSSKLLYFGKYN